jgi:hypothetical protein
MFLFDPTTGETYKEPRNDMDKTTIDACNGAIELLEQTRWIPVSERLPEEEGLYLVSVKNDHERRYSKTCQYMGRNHWFARQDVEAWMPLPEPYKESEK